MSASSSVVSLASKTPLVRGWVSDEPRFHVVVRTAARRRQPAAGARHADVRTPGQAARRSLISAVSARSRARSRRCSTSRSCRSRSPARRSPPEEGMREAEVPEEIARLVEGYDAAPVAQQPAESGARASGASRRAVGCRRRPQEEACQDGPVCRHMRRCLEQAPAILIADDVCQAAPAKDDGVVCATGEDGCWASCAVKHRGAELVVVHRQAPRHPRRRHGRRSPLARQARRRRLCNRSRGERPVRDRCRRRRGGCEQEPEGGPARTRCVPSPWARPCSRTSPGRHRRGARSGRSLPARSMPVEEGAKPGSAGGLCGAVARHHGAPRQRSGQRGSR